MIAFKSKTLLPLTLTTQVVFVCDIWSQRNHLFMIRTEETDSAHWAINEFIHYYQTRRWRFLEKVYCTYLGHITGFFYFPHVNDIELILGNIVKNSENNRGQTDLF